MSKTSQRKVSAKQLMKDIHRRGVSDARSGDSSLLTGYSTNQFLRAYNRGINSVLKKSSGKFNFITWFRNKFGGSDE